MVYAATFARVRLFSPTKFVRRLVRDGEAGDASPIGTDYPMLETAGTVRVVPGSTPVTYRLQLLQPDVAEGALDILTSRDDSFGNAPALGPAGVRGQRSYTHVERERARLAHDAPVDDADTKRLLAASSPGDPRETLMALEPNVPPGAIPRRVAESSQSVSEDVGPPVHAEAPDAANLPGARSYHAAPSPAGSGDLPVLTRTVTQALRSASRCQRIKAPIWSAGLPGWNSLKAH